MSLVFTLMTSETRRQTGRGAKGFIIPNQSTMKSTMWGLVYLHTFSRFVVFFLYLLPTFCASLGACECMCVCALQRKS